MVPSTLHLNPQTSKIFSLLPTTPLSTSPFKLNVSSPTFLHFPRKLRAFPPTFQPSSSLRDDDDDLDEDYVIGDCVVFEEDAFEDPFLRDEVELGSFDSDIPEPKKPGGEAVIENLVPDKWRDVQADINITKKERRKIAQEMQFGTRVEKKRKGLLPLKSVNLEEYSAYREAKLAQLKPLVLDKPSDIPEKVEEKDGSSSSGRVVPRNPRWAVYGKGLDDVTEFFNSGKYDPSGKRAEGRQKLFSNEEKLMLNKRIPDLEAATSAKWLPLHTLAASGEFYLVDSLMKHNADVNAVDMDGWSALHKAILGKKQAITNYLLRESANPFLCDKDGATMMHYAVRTASSQAIKILLLYNVDINLQDNDGWTPLHLAVQARRTDVVRLLLIKGANKTLRNKDGLTPLDLCLYYGADMRTYELIKLLKLLPKQQ